MSYRKPPAISSAGSVEFRCAIVPMETYSTPSSMASAFNEAFPDGHDGHASHQLWRLGHKITCQLCGHQATCDVKAASCSPATCERNAKEQASKAHQVLPCQPSCNHRESHGAALATTSHPWERARSNAPVAGRSSAMDVLWAKTTKDTFPRPGLHCSNHLH